ncbi:hypothetical protein [uncultured Maribacter sp.]|uniref:hypothetical protein n=1 Tax=uncultured Maribacter sp. TaxID=431308 RepID=UPI00260471F1|nr:hypothetical protein [uncultured Maribacter sp.]
MNWKTEITEISNNVYTLTMIHKLGPRIEKTGTDIEILKKEAIADSIIIEKDIDKKTNHNRVDGSPHN